MCKISPSLKPEGKFIFDNTKTNWLSKTPGRVMSTRRSTKYQSYFVAKRLADMWPSTAPWSFSRNTNNVFISIDNGGSKALVSGGTPLAANIHVVSFLSPRHRVIGNDVIKSDEKNLLMVGLGPAGRKKTSNHLTCAFHITGSDMIKPISAWPPCTIEAQWG